MGLESREKSLDLVFERKGCKPFENFLKPDSIVEDESLAEQKSRQDKYDSSLALALRIKVPLLPVQPITAKIPLLPTKAVGLCLLKVPLGQAKLLEAVDCNRLPQVKSGSQRLQDEHFGFGVQKSVALLHQKGRALVFS